MPDTRCEHCSQSVAFDAATVVLEEGRPTLICPGCWKEARALQAGRPLFERVQAGAELSEVDDLEALVHAVYEAAEEIGYLWSTLADRFSAHDHDAVRQARDAIRAASSSAEATMERVNALRAERKGVS